MTTDEVEERQRIDKEIDEIRRGRVEWIASLDVFNNNGGISSSSIGSPIHHRRIFCWTHHLMRQRMTR